MGPQYVGLVNERDAAISNIRHMSTSLEDTVDEMTSAQLTVHLEILGGYWSHFQQTQRSLVTQFNHIEAISESLPDVERDAQELYIVAKAALLQRLTCMPAEDARPRAPRASEIKVDTFSGKYTEWAAWRSQFKAKVLDARIDVADKIALLTGALIKEAATCAGRAEQLDQVELDRMWSKLDRTYDNKYQQVYAHIAEIIGITPMTQPSADKLRSMIDVVDQHLRMLQRFEIETDHWSPMVCVILLGKLDSDTRNQWESKDSLPAMPDLRALFTYLEQRILAIRNVEMSVKRNPSVSAPQPNSVRNPLPKNNMHSKGNRFHPYENKQSPHLNDVAGESRSSTAQSTAECPQCGSGVRHFLWKCDAFRLLTSNVKLQQLAKWGICEVCLVARHKADECTKGTCPTCKSGRHNSLVCPQAEPKRVHHVRRRSKPRNVKPEQ